MTLGFALLTLGATLVHSAFSNRSLADILLNRPGPGQPPPIAGATAAAAGGAAGGGGGGVNPGGGWGGAKGVVDSLTRGSGLVTVSTKRDTQSTSSGGTSDHWKGCKECYAKDLSGSVSAMDRAAKKIMKRLGVSVTGKSTIEHTAERKGYRIQVLYRTYTGGNHYNHIHVGARKIGYTP